MNMQKIGKILIILSSLMLILLFSLWLFVRYTNKNKPVLSEESERLLSMMTKGIPTPITADSTDEVLAIVKKIIQTKNASEVTKILGGNFSTAERPEGWSKTLEKLDYFPFSRIVVSLKTDDENLFSQISLDIKDGVKVDRNIFVKGIVTDESQVKETPPGPDDFYHTNESIKINETTQVWLSIERDSNRIVDLQIVSFN